MGQAAVWDVSEARATWQKGKGGKKRRNLFGGVPIKPLAPRQRPAPALLVDPVFLAASLLKQPLEFLVGILKLIAGGVHPHSPSTCLLLPLPPSHPATIHGGMLAHLSGQESTEELELGTTYTSPPSTPEIGRAHV